MKDKDITLQLVDVFKTYLDINGLTISYAARCTKIPRTSLAEWAKGQRCLTAENARKVKEFLKGSFLINVDTIVTYLAMQQEGEGSR
ncbi:XRE family transcriptional regulator [Ruminococcus sp. AM40-10AC]|nr:XRE family transcriptional regulator [Ruminococcus sp. AM40-10AC]